MKNKILTYIIRSFCPSTVSLVRNEYIGFGGWDIHIVWFGYHCIYRITDTELERQEMALRIHEERQGED